ncbi:MAG: hypothetical protein EXR73_12265 [Myxococcales bacterium]|nr:hypothetical protein [Myxococcales bacterium]
MLTIAPAHLAAVKPGDTIFLAARAADGSLLGVEILSAPATWPLAFTISARAGARATITARVDRDSDAGTRAPGDLEGQVVATAPSSGAALVIDTPVR